MATMFYFVGSNLWFILPKFLTSCISGACARLCFTFLFTFGLLPLHGRFTISFRLYMDFCLMVLRNNLFQLWIWRLYRTFVMSVVFLKHILQSLFIVMTMFDEWALLLLIFHSFGVTPYFFCRSPNFHGFHFKGGNKKRIYHKTYTMYENSTTFVLATSQPLPIHPLSI